MGFEEPKINRYFYLIGLTRDEDYSGSIMDIELEPNKCVAIIKKKYSDGKPTDYVKYTVIINDNIVDVIKQFEEDIVEYKMVFKKIIDKNVCMVRTNGDRVAFYEFDTDFLTNDNASYSNVINYEDYFDNKKRGR